MSIFRLIVFAAIQVAPLGCEPSPVGDENGQNGIRLDEESVSIPGTETKFTLVRIPGGKLGDRELRNFWIGKHEVSWEEYRLFYKSTRDEKVDGVTRPSQPDVKDPEEPFKNGAIQTGRHPAICVGWFGAAQYCEWLSRKTGHPYRLPTEAEWEYAARAGASGETASGLDELAWHKGNSGNHTHPIGSKKPNAWGLHDILGNAWEHCLEPKKPPSATRVVKGGAWHSPAAEVTFKKRGTVIEEWADSDPKRPLRLWWITDGPFVGFRIVRIPEAPMRKDLEAVAKQVAVKNLKMSSPGSAPWYFAQITGEVTYTGERPLEELQLVVYFLAENGKPLWRDPKDKPTWNLVHPVLINAHHVDGRQKPMRKGEMRKFQLEIPFPFDEVGPLDYEDLGAKVTRVRFAK